MSESAVDESAIEARRLDRLVHQAFAVLVFVSVAGSLVLSGAVAFALEAPLFAVGVPLLVAYYYRVDGRDADLPVPPASVAVVLGAASATWAVGRFGLESDAVTGTVPFALVVVAFGLMAWNVLATAGESSG